LRNLPRIGLTAEDLNRRLGELTPKWIHHPGEEPLRARLAKQLRDREAGEAADREARFAQRYRGPEAASSSFGGGLVSGPIIKTLWLRGVELRIKKHPLCEGIVIWAAESNDLKRVTTLFRVAEALSQQQIPCNSRNRRFGYLIAWGEVAAGWANTITETDLGG
jgi:hypothetical protein